MPELGDYATEIISAYVASGAILVMFVAAYIVRARRVRAALEDIEKDG